MPNNEQQVFTRDENDRLVKKKARKALEGEGDWVFLIRWNSWTAQWRPREPHFLSERRPRVLPQRHWSRFAARICRRNSRPRWKTISGIVIFVVRSWGY